MTTQTTAPRTRRVATPERWQAALARAIEKGVEVRQIAGTGEYVASSGSRAGVAYRTDGTDCECEAAQLGGDPVCVHRARYWQALGMLDLDAAPAEADAAEALAAGHDALAAALTEAAIAADAPAPEPTGPAGEHGPYRVVCPGCGSVGYKLQDKPLAPGFRCKRCETPPAPRPGTPRPPAAPALDFLAVVAA